MQAENRRQSTRITERRKGRGQPAPPAEMRHVNDTFDPEERRRARLAMLGLGLSFVTICVGYVVLAGGNLLG